MDEHKPRVEVPRLGAQTADTHAHLDMLDDPAGALERAASVGVMYVATVVDVTESPLGTFDALGTWLVSARQRMEVWGLPHPEAPTTRIIVGVHPHNAKAYGPEAEETLRELVQDPRVAAIGEIGLDFHYDHSPRDDQRRAFEAQLTFAHEARLPIAVHLREAHEEGMAILRSMGVPAAGCIIHCFTEGPKTADMLLEMGCDIAFGGSITFPKADIIREAAAVVPLDRLLAETDSPFMTPVPHRGRSNEPAWVAFTIEKLAEVKGLSSAEVAAATLDNARRILGEEELIPAMDETPPLAPGTVLGIAGSPRRGGNSEALLDACLAGASGSGAPVFKLPVVEYGIAPCRGCNACSLTGECVVRDRMREVYALLDSASAVIVSTPVYFATVPAVLKALYDRCQPYWARRHELGQPAPAKRPGGLLVVRSSGDPFGYECAVTTTRSVFAVVRLRLAEPVVVEGVDSPSEIGRHPEAMEMAAELGVRLAGEARPR